jgi:ADP-ribose pyrophosphatase YjhB (NUDIX family)
MQVFNIGIKGVIVKDDRVLILKSTDGYWEVPGGRMEEGEEIKDTLRRELAEELPNIAGIQIHEAIAAFKIQKQYIPGMSLMLIFFRVSANFEGDIVISDEHNGHRWATKAEALELCEEATQEAITSAFED